MQAPPYSELRLYRSVTSLTLSLVGATIVILVTVFEWIRVTRSWAEFGGWVVVVLVAAGAVWQLATFRAHPRLTLRQDGLVRGDKIIPWSEVTGLDVATVRRHNRTTQRLNVHVRDRSRYVEGWQAVTGEDYVPIEVSGLTLSPEQILQAAEAYRRASQSFFVPAPPPTPPVAPA